MKKNMFRWFGMNFCVCFLPIFMLLIFGPTEIFIGNYQDFGVVYGEFGWKFLMAGIALTIVAAGILVVVPEKVRKIVLTIIFGISVDCYIQGMLLNKGLEMLGATAEGYHPGTSEAIQNILIWIGIFVVIVVFVSLLKNNWKKMIVFGSLFLVLIQMSGFISLFFTADKEAFQYKKGELCLSGQ